MATKKWVFVFMLVMFLSLIFAGAALAGPAIPAGSCPAKWELHPFMEHEDHPDHHVGLTQDLNGDGFICMMMTESGKHVHMDNVLP